MSFASMAYGRGGNDVTVSDTYFEMHNEQQKCNPLESSFVGPEHQFEYHRRQILDLAPCASTNALVDLGITY